MDELEEKVRDAFGFSTPESVTAVRAFIEAGLLTEEDLAFMAAKRMVEDEGALDAALEKMSQSVTGGESGDCPECGHSPVFHEENADCCQPCRHPDCRMQRAVDQKEREDHE